MATFFSNHRGNSGERKTLNEESAEAMEKRGRVSKLRLAEDNIPALRDGLYWGSEIMIAHHTRLKNGPLDLVTNGY